MIGRVSFELASGRIIAPDADYGMLLVNYDAPPPPPKLFTVELEGGDGSIDMSEWTGRVLFEDREVTVALRDMHNQYGELLTLLNGRRVKVRFSDEDEYHYEGRCSSIERTTRSRVTDLTLKFTCIPYRMYDQKTEIVQSVGNATSISLQSALMPVVPEITLTAACTLTYQGQTYSLAAGTHTIAGIVVVDTSRELTVSGSGKITLRWRDGVL